MMCPVHRHRRVSDAGSITQLMTSVSESIIRVAQVKFTVSTEWHGLTDPRFLCDWLILFFLAVADMLMSWCAYYEEDERNHLTCLARPAFLQFLWFLFLGSIIVVSVSPLLTGYWCRYSLCYILPRLGDVFTCFPTESLFYLILRLI